MAFVFVLIHEGFYLFKLLQTNSVVNSSLNAYNVTTYIVVIYYANIGSI